MMNKKKIATTIKEYFLVGLGVVMYALGWTIFLVPNNLVGGGVTGIASIIQYATGGLIKIGYTYFVLNIGLLVLALFTLGKSFGVKTVYAIIVSSVSLLVLPELISTEFINSIAIENGKLMSTLMGALLVGVGIGTTFNNGGSTGGTDIIALVVNKYRNVSPGRMILVIDAIVILSSLLVPSYRADGSLLPFTDKLTTVVYGFILITVMSTVVDMVVAGSKRSVQVFILSPKYEEIANAITRDLHRGVTSIQGKGWYTQTETQVLMVVLTKKDLPMLLRFIKSIDSNAFLSISSVTGVYGKGFDKIKSKANKNK